MEKRKSERYKINLKVVFGPLNPENKGFLEDISISGVKIKASDIYNPGTTLKMNIYDNNSDDIMLAEGFVAWAKEIPQSVIQAGDGGMGIQFVTISPVLLQFFQNIRSV